MAKGLRASVTKRNKSKLRDRVFGPVEAARTERLSAKLMELARQPKPTRDAEMLQVDGQDVMDEKSVEEGEKDQVAEAGEGQCLSLLPCVLACPVPKILVNGGVEGNDDGGSSEEEHGPEETAMDATGDIDAEESIFYALLGLSTDITGFDSVGRLKMLFEH
jgi:hypothetical protein